MYDFSNFLIIQVKFHEAAKYSYLFLHNKMELLQPGSLIESKKSPLKSYVSNKIFPSNIKKFLKWDRRFHLNVGLKSCLLEPAHQARPAYLIWTAP